MRVRGGGVEPVGTGLAGDSPGLPVPLRVRRGDGYFRRQLLASAGGRRFPTRLHCGRSIQAQGVSSTTNVRVSCLGFLWRLAHYGPT